MVMVMQELGRPITRYVVVGRGRGAREGARGKTNPFPEMVPNASRADPFPEMGPNASRADPFPEMGPNASRAADPFPEMGLIQVAATTGENAIPSRTLGPETWNAPFA
jgi:hypothetical protein